MTREEFVKRSYKPYMTIYNSRLKEECMLLAVNFEAELFTLSVFDTSDYLAVSKYNEFDEHIKFCEIPKKQVKLKAV